MELAQLPKLEFVQMPGSPGVTDDGVAKLKAALSGLKTVAH
jgi:hypothetical protein